MESSSSLYSAVEVIRSLISTTRSTSSFIGITLGERCRPSPLIRNRHSLRIAYPEYRGDVWFHTGHLVPRRILTRHQGGHGEDLVLWLQVLGEAPGHHSCVTWVIDVLLADRCAIAGIMPPGEAPVQEDADFAAADCADGLGFSGGPGIVVVGLGYIH